MCFFQNKIGDIDMHLEKYFSGELSQSDLAEFELHLIECPECFEKFRIASNFCRVVDERGSEIFREFLDEKEFDKHISIEKDAGNSRIWFSLAAAVVLLLVTISVFFFAFPDQKLAGEAFEPNPYLEELVSLETGAYRSIEVFNLRAPKKDQVFESGEEIVFSWNGQSNSGFSLKILNNDGKQIVKFQTPGTEFQYANTLTAGLYYWKVEAGSNILMNRFYVK